MNSEAISTLDKASLRRYKITGMTCGSCVNSVRGKLSAVVGVDEVEVDLAKGEARVLAKAPVEEAALQAAFSGSKYSLSPVEEKTPSSVLSFTELESTPVSGPVLTGEEEQDTRSFFEIYRPLFTIIGLIALVTVLAQAPFEGGLNGMLWMRHFMAGFFIVFSAFKLLDVSSFANSYAMYDLLAARWRGWGFVYPFVELGLGLAYLVNIAPVLTNWLTILILGFSAIGVIKSVVDKRKIRCACLGSVWNLPMSTVTIVEDLSMVAMAAWMLFYL